MSGIVSPTLAALLLLIPWIPFFMACSPTWREGIFYSYGWAVPWLAFLLFWNRIRSLQFGRAVQTRRYRAGDHGIAAVFIWTVIVLLAGASVLTLRLVETADPFWRFALIFQALWSAGICLLLGSLLLGAPGARVLIGCQVFLASATPLPFFLENGLVGSLNSAVSHLAALTLNFSGNPALLLNSTLLQAGEVFSLNDALGGLRSFPAAVMFALFFGELFRLAILQRGLLILVALIATALGNLLRIVLLFPTGAETAGTVYSLSVTLLLLLIIAAIFRQRERESLNPLPILRWQPAFFFLLLAWPAAELVNLVWWKDPEPRAKWTITPELPNGLTRSELPNLALHFEHGDLFQYPDQTEILALLYAPGDSRSWNEINFLARKSFLAHLGAELKESLPNREVKLGEELWPIECSTFIDRLSGQPTYVFQLAIRGTSPNDSQREDARERMILSRRPGWDGLLILGRVPAEFVTPDEAFTRFEKAVLSLTIPKKAE